MNLGVHPMSEALNELWHQLPAESKAIEPILRPVYASPVGEVFEKAGTDGTITMQHMFRHVRFRTDENWERATLTWV